MKIVCDMDEVLAQFINKVLHRWNLEHKTSFNRDHINTWNMDATLGKGSFDDVIRWMSNPDFFEMLEPVNGALSGIRHLMKSHDVMIATSLHDDVPNAYDSKKRWIKKHLPEFQMRNFFVITRKEMLDGDVLIDDAGHNVEPWCERGREAIVLDAPWNRHVNHLLARRALHWGDIVRMIDSHSE